MIIFLSFLGVLVGALLIYVVARSRQQAEKQDRPIRINTRYLTAKTHTPVRCTIEVHHGILVVRDRETRSQQARLPLSGIAQFYFEEHCSVTCFTIDFHTVDDALSRLMFVEGTTDRVREIVSLLQAQYVVAAGPTLKLDPPPFVETSAIKSLSNRQDSLHGV